MVFDAVLEGIAITFSWPVILWVIIGVLLGIVIGGIPGLGVPVGMAIVLPFTVALDSISAIIVLVGIYSGGMFGGSISAILINAPGAASAAATTLDGYKMTENGLSKNALAAAATASALNGFLAAILLILISPMLITVIFAFGSPEYFLMAVLGLSLIAIISEGGTLKGLIAGGLGFLVSTVGFAVMSPTARYTFGSLALYDGIDFVAVLIGMFAFAEMIKISKRDQISRDGDLGGSRLEGIKSVFRFPKTSIKSGIIGVLVGMLPGAGAATSTFVAYAEEARSNNEDPLGYGNIRGVIAPESANNSTVAGSLVPTIGFGIPGSGATAVLLGGLLMHGLQPGPQLFGDQLHVTYSVYIALFVGNFIILAVGLLLVERLSKVTIIDTNIIIPVVVVLSIAGAFALNRSWVDASAVILFGYIGYFMVQHGYSVIAFILGLVLGPIAEENFYRSLQISDGSYYIFVSRTLSILLILLTIIILTFPILQSYRR